MDIPVVVFDGSAFHPFTDWRSPDRLQPEPSDLTYAEANWQFMLDIQRTGARVILTGQGGDPLFATTKDEFWQLLRRFRWPQVASYLATHVWNYRRLPPMLLRSRLKRRFTSELADPFPDCIERSFADRWGLQERWRRAQCQAMHVHPTRPEAYAGLSPTIWNRYFRRADAAMAKLPMEIRHPLLDVRLVEYLLAVPPSPWFLEKSILRQAVRGKLPERIRRRRKCPAGCHPAQAFLRQHHGSLLPKSALGEELDRFVDLSAVRELAGGRVSCQDGGLGIRLRCLSLGLWLHHSRCVMAEKSAT
jgi:asparagine synthase (glutamine-hydrolysing)